MKKIFLAVFVLVTAFTVSAQEVTVYQVHNPNTVTKVTTAPPHIIAAFEKAYPGETVIAWVPVNAWWRASYKLDNRVIYVFYNDAAVNYRVALPVLQNNVPEDVVNTALGLYGPTVYGIAKMRSADSMDIYQVRLMENGTTRVTYINADGTAAVNVFKTADVVVNM